jgi:hypothetical protein
VRCDEDDRHLPVCRGKVALKLETTSLRHSNVEHQASRAVRRGALKKSETDVMTIRVAGPIAINVYKGLGG